MIHAWLGMSVANSIRRKRRGILWLHIAEGYDVQRGTRESRALAVSASSITEKEAALLTVYEFSRGILVDDVTVVAMTCDTQLKSVRGSPALRSCLATPKCLPQHFLGFEQRALKGKDLMS